MVLAGIQSLRGFRTGAAIGPPIRFPAAAPNYFFFFVEVDRFEELRLLLRPDALVD
jgi:hypothetical protein